METYFLCMKRSICEALSFIFSKKCAFFQNDVVLHSQSICHTSSAIVLATAGLLCNKSTHTYTHTQRDKQWMWLKAQSLQSTSSKVPNFREEQARFKEVSVCVQSDDVITKYLQRVTYKNFETTEYRCLLNGKFFKEFHNKIKAFVVIMNQWVTVATEF